MDDYGHKLFLQINGLNVDEPARIGELSPGPSEPHWMQKFDEQVKFNHAMGKTPTAPAERLAMEKMLERLLSPIDDTERITITPGEPAARVTITPGSDFVSSSDFAKRFTPMPERTAQQLRWERKIVGEDVWYEGYDSNGELKASRCVTLAAEASILKREREAEAA